MDELEVPSGRKFNKLDLELLALMATYKFIEWRDIPFKLKPGVFSHVYVFGREDITDHPDLEWSVGLKIAMLVRDNSPFESNQPCLIGIPTAGTALAQAASMVSYSNPVVVNKKVICHRVMKEVLKSHGVNQTWVNGKPQPDIHAYWYIDNVVTDGASKLEAREKLKESGYPVDDMVSLVLVDRQQGGIQRMQDNGFKRVVVAYNLLDLTFAFGELGLWPKETVRLVEEEIKAHQLG